MKFSIDKSTLKGYLAQLGRVVPARSTLPILSCILFEIKDNRLFLRSTDIKITLTFVVDLEENIAGSIALPYRALQEITNEMSQGLLRFEISEIGKVTIKTDTGTYTMMGKPADEFPALPIVGEAREIILPAAEFDNILDQTIYAVGIDEMKPELMGLLIHLSTNNMVAVATDGHRMVRIINSNIKTEEFEGSVIIPAKFLSVIRQQIQDKETISLLLSKKHVQITTQESTIYTRIIDGKFPDYESLMQVETDKKIIINREDLLASVRRVSIFSNKSTKQITFSIGTDQMHVTTEDPENVRTGRETVDCEYEGDPLIIGFNAAYLRETLMHQKTENIIIKMRTPVSACIFLPTEKTEYEDVFSILMPIRLGD